MKKLIRAIGLGVLLIIITLGWLGFSASGLNWVLHQVPGLSVNGAVEGVLLKRFKLSDVRIEYASGAAQLATLEVSWQASGVFSRAINIEQISIDDLNIVSRPTSGSNEPSELNLPFSVNVDEFNLRKLNWHSASGEAQSLDSLAFSASLLNSDLQLKQLRAERDDNRLNLAGVMDISLQDQGKVALKFDHQLKVNSALVTGSGVLSGTWGELELRQSTRAPYAVTLQATLLKILSPQPAWQANAALDQFDFAQLMGRIESLSLSGSINTDGQGSSGSVLTKLTARSPDIPEGELQLFIDAEIAQNLAQIKRLSVSRKGADERQEELTLSGSVANIGQLLRADDPVTSATESTDIALSGHWQNLQIVGHLIGVPLPVSTGDIELSGRLNDYSLMVQSEVKPNISGQPQVFDIGLTASGALLDLTIDSLRVRNKHLQLDSRARIDLSDGMKTLSVSDVSGAWQGQAISGGAQLSAVSDTVVIDVLDLRIGAAAIYGKGTLGRASDFSWALNLPDLSLLDSRFRGSINSSGSLSGDLSAADIEARYSLKQIEVFDWQLASASGDLQFNLAKQSPWVGKAEVQQVSNREIVLLESSIVTLAGNAFTPVVQAQLHFVGGNTSKLELAGKYQANNWQFDGSIKQLPLKPFAAYAENLDFHANGVVDVDLNGQLLAKDKLLLTATISSQQLQATSKADVQQHLKLDNLQISIEAKDVVKISARALVNGEQAVNAKLKIGSPLRQSGFADAPLQGEMALQFEKLAVLQSLLPSDLTIDGAMQLRADIVGSVEAPVLSLNADWQRGSVLSPLRGIALEDIEMRIRSSANQSISLSGSARAGDGLVAINGQLAVSDLSKAVGQINITADNALLIENAMIRAEGNVDLTIDVKPESMRLSGDVKMNKADIVIGNSASVIGESPDLVLMGEQPKARAITLAMQLNLDLGNAATISARGLKGRLSGDPNIRMGQNGLLTSSGEVKLIDGIFEIAGQKLTITKGVASYAGGSITNPYLSFQATKVIGDISVGVEIKGNLDAPEVSLFSNAGYSDQDILALVFFEKPVDELSSTNVLKLLSIANGLRGGSADSKIQAVTDKLAAYLGVENFDVSLSAGNNQGLLEISSKVNSRLQIGYAYNFISSLQALFLKYKITDNWSIQSSVDVESGADLKYKIERN